MRPSSTFVAALFGLAAAHGDHEGQHMPKLLGGRRFLADLKARQGMTARLPTAGRVPIGPERRQESLHGRQIDDNVDGKCGPGVGSCAPGYCCSSGGSVLSLYMHLCVLELTQMIGGVGGQKSTALPLTAK